MRLLALLSFLSAAAVIYLFVTQILIPFIYDTPLFPMFRKDPLGNQVEKTRAEVNHLEDHVDNLEDLVDLTKKKSKLERELEEAATELKSVDGDKLGAAPPAADVKQSS